jgi:hypothetical protein
MATYTPLNLIGPAASLTTSVTAYVSPAATNGIIRTISACANAAGHSVTIALGADAAATRIIAAFALSANVVQVWNGWWVTAQNSAHAIDATSDTASANVVIGSVNGYQYG